MPGVARAIPDEDLSLGKLVALVKQLTPREREALETIIRGMDNKEGAAAMGCTTATYRNTLQGAKVKLRARTPHHAAFRWMRAKLVVSGQAPLSSDEARREVVRSCLDLISSLTAATSVVVRHSRLVDEALRRIEPSQTELGARSDDPARPLA